MCLLTFKPVNCTFSMILFSSRCCFQIILHKPQASVSKLLFYSFCPFSSVVTSDLPVLSNLKMGYCIFYDVANDAVHRVFRFSLDSGASRAC